MNEKKRERERALVLKALYLHFIRARDKKELEKEAVLLSELQQKQKTTFIS